MESSSVGFIGQMKGKLTTRKYKYATVFVDHFSRYTYVHLQKKLTSEETLEAKNTFEAHCRQHRVNVQHYHADNGRFADNLFVNDVASKGQTLTYCGVNAHLAKWGGRENDQDFARICQDHITTLNREVDRNKFNSPLAICTSDTVHAYITRHH